MEVLEEILKQNELYKQIDNTSDEAIKPENIELFYYNPETKVIYVSNYQLGKGRENIIGAVDLRRPNIIILNADSNYNRFSDKRAKVVYHEKLHVIAPYLSEDKVREQTGTSYPIKQTN